MYYPCSENKDADQLRGYREAISFAVTAKLICVFVFAHANCWFSHAQAQFCSVGFLQISLVTNEKPSCNR